MGMSVPNRGTQKTGDARVVVVAVAVGKREDSAVYRKAGKRLK